MNKLSNTEAEFKKSVAHKKRVILKNVKKMFKKLLPNLKKSYRIQRHTLKHSLSLIAMM